MSDELRPLETLRHELNGALAAKFGPYLEPGESLLLEIERSLEIISVSFYLEDAERTSRLEVEAARLSLDQDLPDESELDDLLDLVVDYVDVVLEDYFEQERWMRHNDDWRLRQYFGQVLRYRSCWRRPSLEDAADAWLAANGNLDSTGKE